MIYIRPAFKFAEKTHRDNFLHQGQIKIGTLHGYRNSEKHSGKILDIDEGKKSIQINFDKCSISGNELSKFGMPFSGKGIINLKNFTIYENSDEEDCFIYCTTDSFFSDSLVQAVSDGYNSCTLIINPDLFYNELKVKFKHGKYLGTFQCHYIDRNIKIDWNTEKNKIKFFISLPAAIIKPQSHSSQREIRAILTPNETVYNLSCKIETIPSLKKYLIPLNFDHLDIDVIKNKPDGYKIGARFKKKDGKLDSIFSIKLPFEVFTPIIIKEIDELFIGFIPETSTNTYLNPTVSNADYGFMVTDIGTLFCVNKLNDILSIEYFSEPDSADM